MILAPAAARLSAQRYSCVEIAPAADIAVVVLCGGRGQRMGGADKGLLPYRDRPLIEHQLSVFEGRGFERLISANRNLDRYRRYGLPVIGDTTPDYPGPLAGMLAALRVSTRPWLVCVPCDLIGLPDDSARRLVSAACEANVPAAYVVDSARAHYACCALHRSLGDSLQAALARQQHAVHRFLSSHTAAAADFRAWRFANLNEPENGSWAAP